MSRTALCLPEVTWWVRVPGREAIRHELAGRSKPADWAAWARALLEAGFGDDYCDYQDLAAGIYRAAYFADGRLEACVHVSRRPDLPDRQWLAALFGRERLEASERMALLAGRVFGATADSGPVVCSCFRVRRTAIQRVIAEHRLTTLREVSECVRAGSSCGSCVPEIQAILSAATPLM